MPTHEIAEVGQPMPEAVALLKPPLPALVVWLRHVG
jgi:hypothetical protein